MRSTYSDHHMSHDCPEDPARYYDEGLQDNEPIDLEDSDDQVGGFESAESGTVEALRLERRAYDEPLSFSDMLKNMATELSRDVAAIGRFSDNGN